MDVLGFDPEKVRLAMDNQRVTTLLIAVLVAQGNEVIVPKDIAEKTYRGAKLTHEVRLNGDLHLKVEDIY